MIDDACLAIDEAKLTTRGILCAAVHNTVEQGIGNTPLLMTYLERDGFVVEAQDLPAALLVITIDKANDIADRDTVSTQALPGLFTNFDIRTVQIDRRIRD